jgi:hypothetical protein
MKAPLGSRTKLVPRRSEAPAVIELQAEARPIKLGVSPLTLDVVKSSHRFVRLNVLDRHTRMDSFGFQIIPLQPFTCRRHPLKITTYTTYIKDESADADHSAGRQISSWTFNLAVSAVRTIYKGCGIRQSKWSIIPKSGTWALQVLRLRRSGALRLSRNPASTPFLRIPLPTRFPKDALYSRVSFIRIHGFARSG